MKKKRIFIVLLLVAMFALGTSFAYFLVNLRGTKKYVLTVNSLRIYLDESKNVGDIVSGSKNIPVTDKEGKETTPYLFSIVNEENFPVTYTIYLDEDDDSTTPTYGLRYNLMMDEESIDKTEGIEDLGTKGNRVLHSTTIPGNTTYNYTLKIWLGLNAGNDCKGTKYSGHLRIEGEQNGGEVYQDTVLNGTDPVLTDNLIPVKIDNDGTVRRASLYDEWYNYEEKLWANAIVLEDKTKEVKVGEIIPESDIQSYFVWIPKYSYQLWNLEKYEGISNQESGKIHTIPIRFGTENTMDSNDGECTTPTSGNGNCKVYDYMTHPAFLAFDSTGFWVGKFESGYKGATTTAEAGVNSSDSTKLQIKPDIYSWRNITVGNAFKASYDYLREEESHMMKNTEWGAASYLHHSNFGNSTSIRNNNHFSYKTGYASVIEPTLEYSSTSSDGNLYGSDSSVTLPYNTSTGYSASTTGNISGIYDMSGGAWEYVMGYNLNASSVGGNSELTNIYSDFFTNSTWEKYYDKYSNSEVNDAKYQSGLIGDATREMGPFGAIKYQNSSNRHRSSWYGDFAHYPYPGKSWFARGGDWGLGVESGIFAFYNVTGEANKALSFRVVLTPAK